MPSLKLCHRRWSLGSDDLLIPAFIFIFLHFLSLVCLGAIAILHFFIDTIGNCDQSVLNLQNVTSRNNSDFVAEIVVTGFCPVFLNWVLLTLCSVILFGAFLLEVAIAYYSSRGTIMNEAPRHRVVPFLATRYVFISAEVCFVAFTYVWFYGCPCVRHSVISALILAIAVFENVVIILLSLFAICSYDFSGGKWYFLQKAVGAATAAATSGAYPSVALNRVSSGQNAPPERAKISHTRRREHVAREAKEQYTRSWFKQFNCMFCCLGNERRSQQATFLEVAKLFGEIFGDTDLVGSDFIAGFILLRRTQKRVIRQSVTKRLKMLSGVPVAFDCHDSDEQISANDPNRPTSKAMLDPDLSQNDAQLIKQIVRVFKFAHSATGWPFFTMQHPGFLVSGPLASCHCCGNNDSLTNPNILNDNPCKLNTQAVLRQTQIPFSHLHFADFEAGIGECAFIVVLDAHLKAVIVSVRGTLSLSDVLTDLNADSAKIPIEEPSQSLSLPDENREHWLAHKGMLTAAIALRDRLINEKILDGAFSQADKLYGEEEGKSANFSLILVGHSLGAGVATLIGILLKPLYANLRVFAFSPPGGLLGIAAARFTKSFVTSIILGKDVVPRIGIRQIEALRADIVNVLKSCKQSKWSVIGNATISCCWGSKSDHKKVVKDDSNLDFSTIKTMRNSVAFYAEDAESLTAEIEFGQNEAFFQQNDDTELVRQELIARRPSANISLNRSIRTHHKSLQLPGSIYHIVRQWMPAKRAGETGHVELKIVRTSRSVYDHVLVSPRMLADHMPNGFMDALDLLVKQHKLDMNNLTPFNNNNKES